MNDVLDIQVEENVQQKVAIEMAAFQLRESIYEEVAETIRQNGIRGLKIGLTIGSICSTIITIGIALSLYFTGII